MPGKYQKEFVELKSTDQYAVALAACEFSGIGRNGSFHSRRSLDEEEFQLAQSTYLVQDKTKGNKFNHEIEVDREWDPVTDTLTDKYVIRFISKEIDAKHVIQKLKQEFC